MDNLFWLDYMILAAVGLLVAVVLLFSLRDSRKRKTSGCSGKCGACSLSCGIRNDTIDRSSEIEKSTPEELTECKTDSPKDR
ncbi:MAG: FeoB-associated Cys-rich membrane protein [Clostridiaceae bacterium]|jgi:hypothetical protein|nr:FeoB-associated Cys-rich membrane protein [Clostridiaceae bacterium]